MSNERKAAPGELELILAAEGNQVKNMNAVIDFVKRSNAKVQELENRIISQETKIIGFQNEITELRGQLNIFRTKFYGTGPTTG